MITWAGLSPVGGYELMRGLFPPFLSGVPTLLGTMTWDDDGI